MSATPSQHAAIEAIGKAIQAVIAEWGSKADEVVTEWIVTCATECPSGHEDGSEVGAYINLHSPGLSGHAARGLHLQAIDRITDQR